ncbi:unnamed protein product [Paramecium sonneborni]|uniref:Uncharacterized protein n=1 Tax=Paramecium sonneborni TaxID=65129 RepID=A0A8S1RR04_9CILI|nr:unnamed protein product [Paramecium sonneborni]
MNIFRAKIQNLHFRAKSNYPGISLQYFNLISYNKCGKYLENIQTARSVSHTNSIDDPFMINREFKPSIQIFLGICQRSSQTIQGSINSQRFKYFEKKLSYAKPKKSKNDSKLKGYQALMYFKLQKISNPPSKIAPPAMVAIIYNNIQLLDAAIST